MNIHVARPEIIKLAMPLCFYRVLTLFTNVYVAVQFYPKFKIPFYLSAVFVYDNVQ